MSIKLAIEEMDQWLTTKELAERLDKSIAAFHTFKRDNPLAKMLVIEGISKGLIRRFGKKGTFYHISLVERFQATKKYMKRMEKCEEIEILLLFPVEVSC